MRRRPLLFAAPIVVGIAFLVAAIVWQHHVRNGASSLRTGVGGADRVDPGPIPGPTLEESMAAYRDAIFRADIVAASSHADRILSMAADIRERMRMRDELDRIQGEAFRERDRLAHLPDGNLLSEDKARAEILRLAQAPKREEFEEIFEHLRKNRLPPELAGWLVELAGRVPEPHQRRLVISLLNNIPDPESSTALLRLLNPAWPKEVRLQIVELLIEHRSKEISPQTWISVFKSEPDSEVKKEISSLMRRCEDEQVRALFRSYLDDPDPHLRYVGVKTLDRREPGGRERLVDVLRNDASAEVRMVALSLLHSSFADDMRQDAEVFVTLARFDKHPQIRRDAVQILNHRVYRGNPLVESGLEEISKGDIDEDIRSLAAYCLKRLRE